MDDTDERIRIGGRILNNFRYADDVPLAAKTARKLETVIA